MPDEPKLLEYNLETSGTASNRRTTASYTLLNVLDEATAETFFLDNTPAIRNTRNRQSFKLKRKSELRGGSWDCQSVWSSDAPDGGSSDPTRPDILETGVSINVGRGGEFVTHSISTILSQLADGETSYDTAPNFEGGIKVTNAETGKPVGEFVDPHALAQEVITVDQSVKTSLITNSWLANIREKLFIVNNTAFRGFNAGEACFFGLNGTVDVQETYSDLSWEFGIRRNLSNVSIGKFSNITKKGWHYAWTYSEKRDGTNGVPVDTPIAIYIEQIFHEETLSSLGVSP